MGNTALILLSTFMLNFFGGTWKPGKVDAKGNLIIVEIENKAECRDRKQHEVISVDSDWSILIYSNPETNFSYFIFDNVKKRIFKTNSFNVFLNKVKKKIPNKTKIRVIDKCTVSFSYNFPDNLKDKLNKTIKNKQCITEDKIMFCYCCAKKLIYQFLD